MLVSAVADLGRPRGAAPTSRKNLYLSVFIRGFILLFQKSRFAPVSKRPPVLSITPKIRRGEN
jgi:hypothetical protein